MELAGTDLLRGRVRHIGYRSDCHRIACKTNSLHELFWGGAGGIPF